MLVAPDKHRAISFIDKLNIFCGDLGCRFYDEQGRPMLHDDMHVTAAGAVFYDESLASLGYFSKYALAHEAGSGRERE
jgi:hypothetical protein